MRVLFLTNVPAPYKVHFFRELGKLCELTVLYERRTSAERNDKWYVADADTYRAIYLDGLHFRADDAICLNVIKYLRKRDYDMVILSGYSTPTTIIANEYLSLKKIPFIITLDGGFAREESGLALKVKRRLVSRSTAYASPSGETDKLLTYYGAREDCIHRYPFTSLVASDIRAAVASPEEKRELRARLGMTEEEVVLSVGQFIHRKGYDVLLESAKELPDSVGIYIVGGTPTPEYTSYVADNNLTRVHFVDFKTKEQLTEYYRAADIFVLPTREDVWGLVINEAMAHGLPVITTDRCVAGLELVRNGENGYVVPVGDSRAIAQRIKQIIEGDSCALMGQLGLEKIGNYTVEKMADCYQHIVLKLVNGG